MSLLCHSLTHNEIQSCHYSVIALHIMRSRAPPLLSVNGRAVVAVCVVTGRLVIVVVAVCLVIGGLVIAVVAVGVVIGGLVIAVVVGVQAVVDVRVWEGTCWGGGRAGGGEGVRSCMLACVCTCVRM